MTHLDSQTKHSHGWKDTFQAPETSLYGNNIQ